MSKCFGDGMQPFWSYWQKERKQFGGKRILLCLDYDGTLSPIAEHYNDAFLNQENKRLLALLSKKPDCKVLIISGRKLSDLKARVDLKKVFYMGNHGYEVEGPDLKYKVFLNVAFKNVLRKILIDCRQALAAIKGVSIEDKGFTISVHYRLVTDGNVPKLKKLFKQVVYPYVSVGKIRVSSGKKVFEIRPPVEWDKGKAVLWFLRQQEANQRRGKIFPIYIGDDHTDEDAFKALRKKSLTIRIGKFNESFAKYYLNNTEQMTLFLKTLAY